MAPTLSTQLLTAVSTKDGPTFTVLLKAMATACGTTELAVLETLSNWYFPVDFESPNFRPEAYLINPLVSLMVQTDRVSDFSKVYWVNLSHDVHFSLCYSYPAFIAKVVVEYDQTTKMPQASDFAGCSPAQIQDYLAAWRTSQYIFHRLLCLDIPAVAQLDPAVQAIIGDILTDQVPSQATIDSLKTTGRSVFFILETLAVVSQSNHWLKSLVFNFQGSRDDPLADPDHQLSRDYYNYMIKRSLVSQVDLATLAENAESFRANWFEAVFNYRLPCWDISLKEPVKTTEAILRQVLDHFVDKEPPFVQSMLDLEAIFKYSESFQRAILYLVLCGKITLVGSTANLTDHQLNSLYQITRLMQFKSVVGDDFTDLVARLKIKPRYETLQLPQLLTEIFEPHLVIWSRQFYDYFSQKMPNLAAKVSLFQLVLLNRVDYDELQRDHSIKLNQADLPVVREALAKTTTDINSASRCWYEILHPSRWSDQGALAQLYHTSSNKGLFLAYALVCVNKDITTEIYRAFKGNGKAKYYDLAWLCRQVTDLTMISHAGRLVDYLSTLITDNRWEYHPNNWLTPELSSYYVE